MESVQQKLAALDKKSEALIQEGKYLESLDVMEEALTTRKNVYGETSNEYYKTSEKLCELCNMLSMIFLQKEKFDMTLEFLKKAEMLAQNSLELKAVTFNNMACYYRRIGKLKLALKCLEDALALEVKLEKTKTLADTHLNICAVYSQLGKILKVLHIKPSKGKHDLAMTHIMKSIILLQDELLTFSSSGSGESSQSTPTNRSNTNANANADEKKQLEDRIAVLAIAYHNLGVEHEYLKQNDEAILTYKKAVEFAKTYLGEESQVTKNLLNVLDTAQSQIEEAKVRAKQKKGQKPAFEKTPKNSTNRFQQASNVYAKEGGRSEIKRFSDEDPNYKTESQLVVDTYSKPPLSGDLVSASSGFTPFRHEDHQGGMKGQNYYDDPHGAYEGQRFQGDKYKGERRTIEESMKEETFNEDSKPESKNGLDHY